MRASSSFVSFRVKAFGQCYAVDMDRRLAFLTAFLGFTGVALGALGAHALKGVVDGLADSAQRLAWWETGARYHLFHALAVGLVAVLSAHVTSRFPKWTAGLFTLGIVLFSGSLYVMALTGVRTLGMVTPFGGLAFLAGWVSLAFGARGLGRQKEAPRPGEP
jgi:uncharacterized membrane protein YgdD (TMEM256/DUF423 family)